MSLPPVFRSGLRLLGQAVALALLLAACSGDNGQQDPGENASTLERIRESGRVRIGYADEAPFAYMDSANGRVTGEAPEVAREVLRRLGVRQVEAVLTEFGSLIPGLNAGRFDIIAAGMYILPERCEQVAFSNPTYGVGQAFIVRKGNPLGLHGYHHVARNPKARLGVVAGAVEQRYARALGVPDERITLFPSPTNALAGVEAQRVDAYAATSLTVQDLADKSTAAGGVFVERAQPFEQPVLDGKPVKGYGAFGFRRGDSDLVAAFNQKLAEFIGTPEHRDLVRQFGFTRSELPGDVTAEELCRG